AVDCSGEAGGTGANDGHVVDSQRGERRNHAQTEGQLIFPGIIQHRAVRANHHWKVQRANVEAIEQSMCMWVRVRIQGPIRMTVSSQETFNSEDIAVTTAADDDRAAGMRIEQADTTQDERTHHALADLGLLHQELP